MMINDAPLCQVCDDFGVGLERTRFFQRQLVTADDLTQDQEYFRARLRRHNRLLHGWGVVCGARCRRGPGDGEIVIEPGFVLGPQGDEITVDREVTVDISSQDLDGNAGGSCGPSGDPWCSNVRVDRQAGDKLYLAVRYAERRTTPVRVPSSDCGCTEQACEYSRIIDSYAFKVLTTLPDGYPDPMLGTDVSTAWKCSGSARPCSPCPSHPWVVLADITLGSDGKIDALDCFAHRRNVVSFADAYFMCQAQLGAPRVASLRVVGGPGEFVSTPPAKFEQHAVGFPVLPVTFEPTAIEVRFGGAAIDASSVTDENFKVLNVMGAPVSGAVTQVPGTNVFRWSPDAGTPPGALLFCALGLLGGPSETAIKSEQGVALDGDFDFGVAIPTGLPSGDGVPGGDFMVGIAVDV